jgi:D-3-phosphoglycerate dehydrogenase
MRALIADKLSEQSTVAIAETGCEVIADAGLKNGALVSAMTHHDPHILVVRSTRVEAAHMQAAPSLSLIIRAGAGVNTIDLNEASERAIYVANCPGKNAVAVAELTWGHILNADRRISDNVAALRAGEWKKKTFSKGPRGLKDRTLGIIGLGSIGQEVMTRGQAFGMKVVAFDPVLTTEQAAEFGVRRVDRPVDAARVADVLTVHVGLTDATRGLISAAVLDALKPGAIFVNTSRGPVVDEAALTAAIERGVRAGLDVFCDEPNAEGPWEKSLASMPGVYGTHHIGASTAQASEAVGDEVAHIVRAFVNEGEVPNCVNLAQNSPATHMLVVRHADEVGVLAGVLDHLRLAGINVQEMENIIFKGARAACARIQLDGAPSPEVLAKIGDTPQVMATSIVATS